MTGGTIHVQLPANTAASLLVGAPGTPTFNVALEVLRTAIRRAEAEHHQTALEESGGPEGRWD